MVFITMMFALPIFQPFYEPYRTTRSPKSDLSSKSMYKSLPSCACMICERVYVACENAINQSKISHSISWPFTKPNSPLQ